MLVVSILIILAVVSAMVGVLVAGAAWVLVFTAVLLAAAFVVSRSGRTHSRRP